MLRITIIALLSAVAIASLVFANQPARSPYAGQEPRGINSLSDREIQDLLAGRGMGFAKAAELNHYPGPAHVLELAEPALVPRITNFETLFSSVRMLQN